MWSQLGGDIDGEAYGDESGYSVSMSSDGTRIAIGAPYNEDGAESSLLTKAGHVRVFGLSEGAGWTQLGGDIDGLSRENGPYNPGLPPASTQHNAGNAVSLNANGDRLAVAHYQARSNRGYNKAGLVRVYEFSGSAWVQLGNDIEGENSADQLGWAISLSSDGSRLAIGAPGNLVGLVRVFEFRRDEWTDDGWVRPRCPSGSQHYNCYWEQLGTNIDGEELRLLADYITFAVFNVRLSQGASFGSAVSLNPNGNLVAVGAHRNAGDSDGRFDGARMRPVPPASPLAPPCQAPARRSPP